MPQEKLVTELQAADEAGSKQHLGTAFHDHKDLRAPQQQRAWHGHVQIAQQLAELDRYRSVTASHLACGARQKQLEKQREKELEAWNVDDLAGAHSPRNQAT